MIKGPPLPPPPSVSAAGAPPAISSVIPASVPESLRSNPLKWSVQQVCDFVKDLPGCSDYIEDFQMQEIDGQALMLLKADHLMSAMQVNN